MNLIKKIIPNTVLKFLRPYYHGFLAIVASWYFGNPSSKMIVVGVTGTAGKSTTVQMLSSILNYHPHPASPLKGEEGKQSCGFTPPHFSDVKSSDQVAMELSTKDTNVKSTIKSGAGFITTVSFFDGKTEYINKHGLSMPGGWLLQKQLRQILNNGCKYAVVECTSEGLAQNRHLGIKFDLAVLTNLSHAHIEAHGGFENYRKAKGKLFEAVSESASKLVSVSAGKQVSKTIIVNGDDENAEWFLQFNAEKKISTRLNITSPNPSFKEEGNSESSPLSKRELEGVSYIKANKLNDGFQIGNVTFQVKLPGEFNLYNALLATVTANQLGIKLEDSAKAISTFTKIRGRMEEVENNRGFKIFVDYGCEPVSIKAALMAASSLPHNKLIHVFGSTGGHRDVQKRFLFGQISAQIADTIIITNDDVYDSDPERIAEDIEEGINTVLREKRKEKRIERHLDRRYAIAEALKLAKENDIVLITGKGSEQFLVLPGNHRIEWDEVSVAKEELNKNDKNDKNEQN